MKVIPEKTIMRTNLDIYDLCHFRWLGQSYV